MSELDEERLIRSLAAIGREESLRAKFLELCRDAESVLAEPNVSIRDEVTGPIIDALHADAGILRKLLKFGVIFNFHYRSKIARELVMCPDSVPDHVWEPQTTKLLVHLADNAKNVIIGGAYSGDQAILVAKKLVDSGGTCHAFEPNQDQLEMLRRNAVANGLENIVFSSLGLWMDDQTVLKLVGDDSFAHPEVVDAEAELDVDDVIATTTVDTYCANHEIEQLDLIMLDIEGAEFAALKGAEHQLMRPAGQAPNLVFEIHRHYVDWTDGLANTEIIRYVADLGYQVYAVRDFNSNVPMGDSPVELVPPETAYLEGPPHGFNMLAVKDSAVIDNVMFRVCPGVSPKLLWHKNPALHHPVTDRV